MLYKKILICAGGTLGHIKPANLIKGTLEKKGCSVSFLLSSQDKKFNFVKNIQNSFFISLKGMPRSKNPFKHLIFWLKLSIALVKIGIYFLIKRPQAVISTGGFIAFPALFWASLFKKPFYLVEQNSVLGLVHRLFLDKASKIFLAMEPVDKEILKLPYCRLVGNPIKMNISSKREGLISLLLPLDFSDKTLIGVLGGSLGAFAVSRWIVKQRESLKKSNLKVILITGKKHYDKFKMASNEDLTILPFVENMPALYSACDYIISRSGATTISELLYYNKPSVFIPYPHATDNHQYYNAQFASRHLRSVIIDESKLPFFTIERLLEDLKEQNILHKKKFENIAIESIISSLSTKEQEV